MTLEQLKKFCGGNKHQFTQKPFRINGWRVATDGYTLVAENGFNPIKLPELEPCANREYILKMLTVAIPPAQYSIDHLKGFLGDDETGLSEPVIFNGHRIDKTKLRKAFTLCDVPYRFTVSFNQRGHETLHTFHFQIGKTIALVMGMREPRVSDPRYEPKLIQQKVSL